MPSFIVQHMDALISTVAGLFACFYGYRAPRAGSVPTSAQQRATKILRICGPLVVMFGLMRFVMEQPAAATWQRHSTNDRFASVEFPGTPEAKQQTDTLNGISVQRTSLTYDVPFKDISMFLSFSPLPPEPPEQPNVPDAERFAAVKAHFTQQGFSIVRESPMRLGAGPGFALDLQRDGGKLRMWIRIAYVPWRVYRVVVSSTGSHHDDLIINHFLESFRVESTGA